MQSKLHSAMSDSFGTRSLPVPPLHQCRQTPRTTIQQDTPRPAWSCGTIAMRTSLHLLLGDRHPHELCELYITITHMLTLHRALLEWLILDTPPALWQLGCLNQHIPPPTWPTSAPTHCLTFLHPRRSPRANLVDQRGRHMANPHRQPNRRP
jgi:hypothetical protein